MDLVDIMLNEINQTEKDKCCIILHVEPKHIHTHTHKSYMQRTDWWLPETGGEGEGLGEMGEVGQNVQTSSYKVVISGDIIYSYN